MERSRTESGNLRAPIAKVAASTLTVMVDRWELNKEDQFPISARAALINGHRTRRKSLRESDAPASQRDAPRDRLTGTHSEYKAKESWPGAAANQSVSNIETSIPHWPPSWDILRRNERLIERAREGLEFSARERERRGSARKTRSGADRTARARAEWSYRTNANLRYWIGLLKTIIETVLNKRQKTRDGVSVFNRAPRGAGAGGGCRIRFILYKKRVYTVIDFFFVITIDRYCETLIRPDARRATRTERVAYVFLCFS